MKTFQVLHRHHQLIQDTDTPFYAEIGILVLIVFLAMNKATSPDKRTL